jgi:hypothetical protein
MNCLLFNSLVLSLLIEEVIDKVLEDLLTIFFLYILEPGIHVHEAVYQVELAESVQMLPDLLKQLLESLTLLYN